MGLLINTQLPDFTTMSLPLDEAGGCGENLEYTAQFLELEEEAQGKPEVQYGVTITQAVEPNWTRVMALALPLLARSRDLRLAIWVTRAQLNLHGIAGLVAGLGLVQGMLAHCWDDLHPRLDPDEANDPLLRINILSSLCAPAGLLRDVLDVPLMSAAGIGAVSVRQIELAIATQGNEGAHLSLGMIEGAFADADAVWARSLDDALTQAVAHTEQIEQWLTGKVGISRALDLSGLAAPLRRACEVIRRCQSDSTPSEDADAAVVPPIAAWSPPASSEIRSRDEARRAIDRLCVYFQAHEPASPVPFLLQRAKALIDKNFMELLQDLAPDGLPQLALISGIHNNDK